MGAFIYKPLLYCYIMLLGHTGAGGVMLRHSKHAGKSLSAASRASGYLRVPQDDNALSISSLAVSRTLCFNMGSGVSKPHPIHVSTSNIEYNGKDNKFEVICTMFTDDFEAALAKQYHAKTDLSKTEMHAAMDALIKEYIAANLKVSADNAPVKLNYLGFEINREATDVYLESDKIPPVKKVDVDASLIYNLFDDEINIVHVIVNGVRKSEKVNYPDKRVEQVF